MKRIKKVTCAFPLLSGRKSRNMEEIQGNTRPEWRVQLFMHPGSTSAKSSQAGVRLCCAPTAPSIALQQVDVLAGRGIPAIRLHPWQQKQQTVKATSGTCRREMKELKLYYFARVCMAEQRSQNHLRRRRVLHRRNRQYFSTKWIDY